MCGQHIVKEEDVLVRDVWCGEESQRATQIMRLCAGSYVRNANKRGLRGIKCQTSVNVEAVDPSM